MRRIYRVSMFLLFFTILTGCSENKTPIRIGTNSWPPCEIWTIAEEQGFFEKTPVEIIRFSSWSDNMSSLYKGNVDITHATYLNALYYYDKGIPAKIFLSSDVIEGSDGLVVKNSITQGEDLKGKTIAVEINTDEHFLLKKALEKFGLKESDITIYSSTSIEASELFIRGEVDACFTYDPYLNQAASEGGGILIWTTLDLPGYMIDVLVASEEVIGNREKDLIKITEAWFRALEYIKDNPEEAFPVMAEAEDMPAEYFSPFFNSFTFFSKEDNMEIFSSREYKNKLEEMNKFLFDHNAIKKKADINSIFTNEIVKGQK